MNVVETRFEVKEDQRNRMSVNIAQRKEQNIKDSFLCVRMGSRWQTQKVTQVDPIKSTRWNFGS